MKRIGKNRAAMEAAGRIAATTLVVAAGSHLVFGVGLGKPALEIFTHFAMAIAVLPVHSTLAIALRRS